MLIPVNENMIVEEYFLKLRGDLVNSLVFDKPLLSKALMVTENTLVSTNA